MVTEPKDESFMSKARSMPQEIGFVLSMSIGKWDVSRGTTALRNQAGKTSETLPGQNTLAKYIHKTANRKKCEKRI